MAREPAIGGSDQGKEQRRLKDRRNVHNAGLLLQKKPRRCAFFSRWRAGGYIAGRMGWRLTTRGKR